MIEQFKHSDAQPEQPAEADLKAANLLLYARDELLRRLAPGPRIELLDGHPQWLVVLKGAIDHAHANGGDIDKSLRMVLDASPDGHRFRAALHMAWKAQRGDDAELVAMLGMRPPEAPSQVGQDDPLTLSTTEPLNSAEKFVVRRRPTLMRCNGDWLDFDGAAYVELEDATIRSELYDFLKGAKQVGTPPKPFNPTKVNVTNIVDALEAVTHRAQAQFAPPCWLEGTGPEPLETIVCQNGLLHLPTGKLHHATPRFYTRNALPFEFDPAAPEPERWLQFLDEVWPGKNDEIGTLQEIFGYLLVPDTTLQKIFMLVGPARSGKGTIARVLTHLVGKPNISAPTLNSLSGDFGLQPLIGKQLALISDMRLGQKTDHAAVAENLLRISGEDTVDVHRKYKSAWTGLLAVRFFIMTNILPRFVDASGVLASRFVPLIMRQSFVGRENPRLLEELLPERPGILNWSIEGWRRLQKRRHFVLPTQSEQAIQQLRDLASPQAAFIRDRCQLDPDAITPKSWVFDAWKVWCEEQGRIPGALETFSAGLLAASNGSVETCKPRSEDGRVPSYRGIRLIDELGNDPPF